MEYQEESIFNMALAYLKRIDKLLYYCVLSSSKGDANSWNKFLRAYYRELSIKFTDDEKKEVEGKKEFLIDLNSDDNIKGKEKSILNKTELKKEFKTNQKSLFDY